MKNHNAKGSQSFHDKPKYHVRRADTHVNKFAVWYIEENKMNAANSKEVQSFQDRKALDPNSQCKTIRYIHHKK
jgi:hypothetical protein